MSKDLKNNTLESVPFFLKKEIPLDIKVYKNGHLPAWTVKASKI